MASKRDYYEVLGIHKGATDAEIKSAFRKKAMEFHPDKNKGNKDAEEKFKEVNEAYNVLSDPTKKGDYDKYGHAGVDQSTGAGPGPGGFSFDDLDFDFGDIFGSFFGGRGNTSRKRSGPVKGADLQKDIGITFEEAVFGTKKTISIIKDFQCSKCNGTGAKNGTAKQKCPTCGGSGQLKQTQKTPFGMFQNVSTCPKCHGTGEIITEKCEVCNGSGIVNKSAIINVQIPAGVDDGMILPLRGEGEPGRNGGQPGDLYLVLEVEEHKFYKRKAQDLYLDYPITPMLATIGGEIFVPTLKGKIKQKIPAGTSTGQVFRIKDGGVKHMKSNRTGDLYVKVIIETPQKLSSEEKTLYKKLLAISNDNSYKKIKEFKQKTGI